MEVKTKELAIKLKAYRPDHFNTPDGANAHEETTGEEIYSQTGGEIDAFVTYVFSEGTFVGTSRALKNHNKNVKCFVIELESTPCLTGKKIISTRQRIQGGVYAFKPPFWNNSLVDGYLTVSDEEAFTSARNLARKEGIFAGYSSGANVAASLKTSELLEKGSYVVTILPDSGFRYLHFHIIYSHR